MMQAQALGPSTTFYDFLGLDGISPAALREVLQLAAYLKRRGRSDAPVDSPLHGRHVALLFEKPSLRTRTTFEIGVRQLGGNVVYLGKDEVNLGIRESVADVARNLERWVDAIVVRTGDHGRVLELAQYASVPVVNALSDHEHPCQAVADMLTLEERLGRLTGLTLAYVGDGNNMVNSLAHAAAALGLHLRIATPPGYEADPTVIARAAAACRGGSISVFHDPREAVTGAHAVYTDTWVSMGWEKEHAARVAAFGGFQVNDALMASARRDALFLHCLPAHRGEEVTDAVMDGPTSVVFDQAENRLHAQKALLSLLAYS